MLTRLLLQRIPNYRRLRLIHWSTLSKFVAFVGFLVSVELLYHSYSLQVSPTRNAHELDRPFQTGCSIPDAAPVRANATILMLAKNSDIDTALSTIISLEKHFNQWYRYPILFLNNEPWDAQFIQALSNATSGRTTFDVIPASMWSYPEWIDEAEAKSSVQGQDWGEGYHHMCRFYSGMFYDMPSLQKYRWFWRVEPHVDFTCSITYDPFIQMERRGKKYGYTIALWEVGSTAPSLFRLVDDYRRHLGIGNTDLWKAMLEPAWIPWPFRGFLRFLPHHTADGDYWNFCHYWSNFEIADLDFFRSTQYRKFFNYLDRSGGFYFERFGDAPIHSLAAALFLQPSEIHHFADFGYKHKDFWIQPNNAAGLQFPAWENSSGNETWTEEIPGALGCRCEKSEWKVSLTTTNLPDTCYRRLGEAIKAR